ncbi:hypothetical protein EZV62_009023 [Acer yangbiense]|uniref:FHA domain-containing protein n=1 Tax=Acer yangbiense TaxID=1000413 RepID=A0A5C7IFD8_9ROSI|nr:hypothetical protein EZV62_009023 [Acer yangbiense]
MHAQIKCLTESQFFQGTNSRGDEHRNDDDDSVARMKAAAEALELKEKEKPSFELSGKLAAETNRFRGITLLFNEPPEARKPDVRWRLYVFKGGEVLNGVYSYLSLNLFSLLPRKQHISLAFIFVRKFVIHCPDLLLHNRAPLHTSSKLLPFWEGKKGSRHSYRPPILQQATCCHSIQVDPDLAVYFIVNVLEHCLIYHLCLFRQVEKEKPDGTLSRQVRPYLMDLGSTNKTYLNEDPVEPQRYYELLEKDTIKFGNSSREYVLLHENSTG